MIVCEKIYRNLVTGTTATGVCWQKEKKFHHPLGPLLTSRCLRSSVNSWPQAPPHSPWHKKRLNFVLSQDGSLGHLSAIFSAFRIRSLSLPWLLVTQVIGCHAAGSSSFYSITLLLSLQPFSLNLWIYTGVCIHIHMVWDFLKNKNGIIYCILFCNLLVHIKIYTLSLFVSSCGSMHES